MREGGPLDDEAASLLERVGPGQQLPTRVRRMMGDAFRSAGVAATDFGDVRVHTGREAARFNDAIGAQAAALGPHLYFRDGLPDVSAPEGAHLLAHELAHVTQDATGVRRRVIRRMVGFELEDATKEARILLRPLTRQERARHEAVQPMIAPPGRLHDPNVTATPPKGLKLTGGPRFELQADEIPIALGPPLGTVKTADLEFVTEPLDENDMASVRQTARGIEMVTQTMDGFRRGHDGWVLPAHAYRNVLFRLGAPWEFKPQFTFEIRSRNIPQVMEDLGKPENEAVADRNRRNPGRLRVHGAMPGQPQTPRQGAGMKVMGTAPQLARWAIAQLQARPGGHIFTPAASQDLVGVLSVMVQYVKMASMTIPSYAKVIGPLMSRHSIAKLFSALPAAQRNALALNNAAELETTLLDAVNHILNLHVGDTVYAAGGSVFHAFTPEVDDLANPGQKTRIPVLNDVTIRDWVRQIPLGRDLLSSTDYAHWVDQANALVMQPRTQAQNEGIEQLESLGSKGMAARRRDAAGNRGGAFEFRGAANDRVTPAQLSNYMEAVADYVRDLANNGHATLA